MHNVDFVDESGQPMDRDLVLGHGHDADGNHIHDEDDHDERDVAAAANAVISATDQSNTDSQSEDAES